MARHLPKKTKSFRDGTLEASFAESLIAKHVKGKFASSSIRRLAQACLKNRIAGDYATTDILYHSGKLVIDSRLSTAEKPWIAMLIVDGDLVVKGAFEDSLDPESIVIVTGSLHATDVISEGFLEVHGDVIADRSALFLDNDGCAEIFGDLTAPFVYTKYHAVNVHGRVNATLATGDAEHIRSKTKPKYGFIDETDRKVRDRLSPKLLTLLADEIFDEEEDEESDPDDPWIDYIASDKLASFVRGGGFPLIEASKKPTKKKPAKKKSPKRSR